MPGSHPHPSCGARQLPAQHRPPARGSPCVAPCCPQRCGESWCPQPGVPAVAEHHWAGPLLLVNATQPPPTTLPKPIYPPHLKKVIKWKGRSYLFLCCASPELSNSQIKSQKCLMKDGGESRGCAGSHVEVGSGCRAAPGAGAGFGGGSRSPTDLPGQVLVVAAVQKETHILPRARFGKSKAEAAGGLPGKQHMSANSHFHIRWGCPATGTACGGTAAASAACASPAQD